MDKEYKYFIKANHPILKRMDIVVYRFFDLCKELDELLEVGYEISITKIEK
jgi:hypothetical protein